MIHSSYSKHAAVWKVTNMYIPLAGRETILETLVLLLRPPLALTQMVYFVLHWRLGKVALVGDVVVSSTP